MSRLKILLADDDEYNLIVATDTLKLKTDALVTTASNGKEAIALLEKHDFDVILMDVQMPEMDGLEATRYIRENFPSPKKDIPIIALTGSTLQVDLDNCRQAGMNASIPKPFSAEQLIKGIEQITGKTETSEGTKQRKINSVEKNTTATDLSYLRNFCEGDAARMKKYIALFLDSAPALMEKIRSAALQDDFIEIANQVHGYKTKWVMMGMHEAKNMAVEIEQQCRQEPVDQSVKENIEQLLRQIQAAEIELKSASLQFK